MWCPSRFRRLFPFAGWILAFFAGGAALPASASQGPRHLSLRPLAMGNAFVAVADDQNALYYNPAGLNRIGREGSAEKYARLNLPGSDGSRNYARDYWGLHERPVEELTLEDILADTNYREDLGSSGAEAAPVPFDGFQGAEYAVHDFGISYWGNVQVLWESNANPTFPSVTLHEYRQTDIVLQIGGSRDFFNQRLSVGAGYSLANRREQNEWVVPWYDPEPVDSLSGSQLRSWDYGDGSSSDVRETLQTKVNHAMLHPRSFDSYGHGLDLGVIWQQTSWLSVGASARNLGMYLDHEWVNPDLTVGFALSPAFLNADGFFSRKVNLAADYQNLLRNDRNYKAPSKINFGAELEQNFSRFAGVRLAAGAKGGYWTAGAGVSLLTFLHLDVTSWAEEAGYFTGDSEERHYAFNLALGL